MANRSQNPSGQASGFLVTLFLVAALIASGCVTGTEAWEEEAQEAAQAFWHAVMDGDVDAVSRSMSVTADQTAEEIVAAYEGFSFSGSAHAVPAKGYREAQAFVLVGLLTPGGDTTLHITAMSLSDGQWLVVYAGQSYTEQSSGS